MLKNNLRVISVCLIFTVPFLFFSCSQSTDFTQIEGFQAIRKTLQQATPPTEEEKQLLKKYKPQLFVDKSSEGIINFYNDYIASGTLQVNNITIDNPTKEQLNAYKNLTTASFVHLPQQRNNDLPVVYGSITHQNIDMPLIGKKKFTFLSYHFVFRNSGLPAYLGKTKQFFANLVGVPRSWHQLDHYTAVFLLLEKNEPRAVLLQQHNHMRLYFFGDSNFSSLPIQVDAAISSNELYPHKEKRTLYRTAGYLSKKTVDYLLLLSEQGTFNTAKDITEGTRLLNYKLEFLHPNDAFYVFEGYLGKQKILPGGDGPPGAIYRTLPQLWDLSTAAYVFYWTEKDKEYAEILHDEADPWYFSEKGLQKLQLRFVKEWEKRFSNK